MIISSNGLFQVTEVDVPTPRAGEVLIQIVATGVCHTDVHACDGDWPVKSKMPLIPVSLSAELQVV